MRKLPLQHWPVFGEPLCQALGGAGESLTQLDLACGEAFFEVRLRNIERPVRGGMQRLGQMIYLRDVTARHQSEVNLAVALALSEERLSTISELHEQLREQALHDPLTGLYNRRYLGEFFEREQSRALRDRLPLALALIDLDHFKRLNDSHGHLVGVVTPPDDAGRPGRSTVIASGSTFPLPGERRSGEHYRSGSIGDL